MPTFIIHPAPRDITLFTYAQSQRPHSHTHKLTEWNEVNSIDVAVAGDGKSWSSWLMFLGYARQV